MHKPSVCPRCHNYNDGFLKFSDKGCDCTDQQLQKFGEEQLKKLQNRFNGCEPSIGQCKRILQANGYIVKKNKKLKRRN